MRVLVVCSTRTLTGMEGKDAIYRRSSIHFYFIYMDFSCLHDTFHYNQLTMARTGKNHANQYAEAYLSKKHNDFHARTKHEITNQRVEYCAVRTSESVGKRMRNAKRSLSRPYRTVAALLAYYRRNNAVTSRAWLAMALFWS